MNTRNFRSSTSVLLLALLAAAPVAQADEVDEAIELLKGFANKTLNDPDFVKTCMGFTAVPELCDAGDAPGSGLVCPPPPAPTSANHTCEMMSSAQLDAGLGTKIGQLIKLTAEFTIHFQMIGEEKSIPAHLHQLDCSGSSCAPQYIKRQDSVKVFFAMAQKGKISVTPPANINDAINFSVSGEKAQKFIVGEHHYCTKVDHGQPLSCGKKAVCTGSDCGPITPGGGSTGGSTGGETGGEPGPVTGGDATVEPDPHVPACEVEVVNTQHLFLPGGTGLF